VAEGLRLPGGGYCRSCGRLGFETLAAPIIKGVLVPCWAAWASQPGWVGVQAVRSLPGPPGRPPGLFSRAQNSLFYHFFNSEFKYKSVLYVI
jgi:hypothetical protein